MSANKSILDRDLARQMSAAELPDVLEVMRNLVDEGSHLLARLNQTIASPSPPRTLHIALLLLLRHSVEQADAVDELFREGCFQPARLQVRSVVEARMQVLFMLGKRNGYLPSPLGSNDFNPVMTGPTGQPLAGDDLARARDRRGRAYLTADLRRQLQKAEALEATVAAAKMQRLTGQANLPAVVTDPATQTALSAEVSRLKGRLSEPENAPIDGAFDQARGKGKHDPVWYALDGGPRTVGALARSVGMALIYEEFYGEASLTMHAGDVQTQIGPPQPGGGHSIGMLRQGPSLDHLIATFVTQMLFLYEDLITEVRPGDHSQWSQWVTRWTAPLRGEP